MNHCGKKTKYKSPSQKQKDTTRKQHFEMQKLVVPNYVENTVKPEVTPSVLLYCDVCEFTTPSKNDLDTHTSRNHKYELIEHLDWHASVEFVRSLDKDGDEFYLCDFCDQRGKKKNMKDFYNKEYQNHSYTCDQDCEENLF